VKDTIGQKLKGGPESAGGSGSGRLSEPARVHREKVISAGIKRAPLSRTQQ